MPTQHVADADLLSALHNQRWGQPAGVVEHWLRAAATTDRSSVDRLAMYFAMSKPEARFWLSVERLGARSPRMHWFLRNCSHQAVLDAEFDRRALRILDEEAAAVSAMSSTPCGELKVEGTAGANRLEPYWRERNGPPQEETVFTPERDQECRYGFVTSGTAALRLECVLAAGTGLPGGIVSVRVNRAIRYQARWYPTGGITTCGYQPSPCVGGNELKLRWPVAPRTPESITSALAESGLGPESRPLARIAGPRISQE